MSVKVRVLLGIVLLTIFGAFFIVGELADELHHDPEYTAQSSAVYTDDFGVFFMENWNGRGRLYRIEDSGKVRAITGSGSVKMDRSEAVAVSNGRVYGLFSSENTDPDGSYHTYRIGVYDEDLKLAGVSGLFTIDEAWTVSSLTADGMCLYISAITRNGGNVTVFSVPLNTLHGPEDLDASSESESKDTPVTRKDFESPTSILHRERTTERFYVDARYVDPELHVLLDGDAPEGEFAPDSRIKAAVDSISFTLGQKISFHAGLIIKTLGLLAIWLILVIITVKVSKDRDRIVYLFSASVVVFFLILFIAFLFIKQQFQKNEINNDTRFAMMVMQEDLKYYSGVDYDADNFFESTKYYRLMESLTDVLNENGDNEVFYDAFVMRKSTGLILADARGHNAIHASYLYGGEMSSLIEQLQDGEQSVASTFLLDEKEITAVAYLRENPEDDLALVAICKDKRSSESFRSSIKRLGILFIVIFLIGSVLLFITLYMQHLDLKHFTSALKGLALGEPKVEASKTAARDMRELWQSYGELAKRIEEINYDKYRIFEAYYRFAPKGIEKIVGRKSIFDVENGNVVTVDGALILLSVDREEEFERRVSSLSFILTKLDNYSDQYQYENILISRDQSLSNARFLMLKEKADTISQIAQFINSGSRFDDVIDWSVLMYRDVFTYGVAGSPKQSMVYIDSDYSRKMDAYSEWFRSLGVPLVVTEQILRNESPGEVRYIGCAKVDDEGEEVRFYEVLDAYPAGLRQLLLMTRDRFEETLELYYSKNFYLARNQFMDILKECPEDGITKWYIFECEKYMNGEADGIKAGYMEIQQ